MKLEGFKLIIPGRPPAKSNSYRIVHIKGFSKLVPTAAVKAYEASVIIIAEKFISTTGHTVPVIPNPTLIEVVMIWHRADHRRKDLDNISKSIKDGLTKGGIWTDDSQVATLVLTYIFDASGVTNEWVDVYVRPIKSLSCTSDVEPVLSVSDQVT